MFLEGFRKNLGQMKEVVRELYVFSGHLDSIKNLEMKKEIIDSGEKVLLEESIESLKKQLKILNNSLPNLVDKIGIESGFVVNNNQSNNLQVSGNSDGNTRRNMDVSRIQYKPSDEEKVSVMISEKDKSDFLDNLSRSRLSIDKLKKKYSSEKKVEEARKPSKYAKYANYFFRNYSRKLIEKGYLKKLNKSLRKINSRFVVSSYMSIVLFTSLIAFILGLFVFIGLLFFQVSFTLPFISFAEEGVFLRALRSFWVLLVFPAVGGLLVYLYPFSEAKNLGSKINQELPFATIHMSAIASSGVEPVEIFDIILKGKEYKYVGIEFKKLMNLINFHGEDIVSALKKISNSSASVKLRELLNGFAITIKSGGNLHQFLSKHAENMLFDYKLEREKYTKISETFMDIYISVAIAAPMILLMVFVIIGSTGLTGGLFNLSIDALSILLIMIVVFLNLFFIGFLKIKQPAM